MKKIFQRSPVKKILYFIVAIPVFVLLLDYVIMPWYVSSPERVVQKVIGLNLPDAEKIILDANLTPVISDTSYDERYPRGTVFFQRPAEGTNVKEGRNIYLFVSGGEPTVTVPALKGKSLRDARFALERIGLKLGIIEEIPSSNPKDMIVEQQFPDGSFIRRGASVGVSISLGLIEGNIVVPDLLGKSLTEAERIIGDSLLVVGKINYQPSYTLLPNTVLDQYPSPGNRVNEGTHIDLFVTKSPDASIKKEVRED